jgi:hypothetical protein
MSDGDHVTEASSARSWHVGARTFGPLANDAIYRVFGNAANVPDGTGTDLSQRSPTPEASISSASPSLLVVPDWHSQTR